ncbi:hypothetical protein SCLCIDRAFT_33648 [Scleroderma citrinum Foug A]|uniref:Uncharacterized protein n=1 Tax=Scleroderma citrinum Foug A TaxID=1036808 RepID=A0A0C3D468_9AGAM|nr:hypothetical protein SCLCIDRAFT_33648 [Scleroderma citrinum Foug A]
MSASSNTQRLQQEKANLHPGRILLETQTKRHTPAQKKADDLHAQQVINAQAAAIEQAHACIREMEATMEARQGTQNTAKAKPVELVRQAPVSRERPTNIPVKPLIEDAHQGTSTNLVAAKARQATQDKGMPVKLRWTASLQEKPGSIAVQGCVEEVAHKEVNAHQVTGPVVVDCASSKPHIRRIASRALRRHGAVSNLNLLASVVLARGPNFENETLGPSSSSVPSLTSKATTAVSSNTNLAYQGKTSVPTHYVDKEELEDQLAFPVKVVVTSMANDDDEFDQPIHEEVQAGSKRKYSDRDDAGYVTSSEVEDFDFDFDMEDHKMNFRMWPDEESCGTMINSGEDILKKAKVESDGQVFSTKTEGRGSKWCFRMQDLPSMLMVDKLWMKEIIPALLMWAGTLADPWTISDAEFMQLLRTIIQTIAPDFEDLDDICPGKAIFYIASQQLCTWHSNFGSTAVTLIAHFLVSNKKIGMPSLKQSCFVLYRLGHAHLRPCGGAPDIPELRIGNPKETGIKGALALTCVALHHTFSLFRTGELQINVSKSTFCKAQVKVPLKMNKVTGKESSSAPMFSEQNCGSYTCQFVKAIEKHDDTVLHNIIVGATTLVPYTLDALWGEESSQDMEDINDLIAALCKLFCDLCALLTCS